MARPQTTLPAPGEAPTGTCECGCGQPVTEIATYTAPQYRLWIGYPRPYLPGHRPRAKRVDAGVRQATKYAPIPSEIPSGVCECGCGGATEVAERTHRHLRWFRGHPKPFIKGHHARGPRLEYRGERHHLWKGGRIRNKGYIWLYRPEHHRANRRGYVPEHILVWEEANGQLLPPGQDVHHKDRVRDNNVPANLVALTKSAHAKVHEWDAGQHLTTEQRRAYGRKGAASRWGSR